MKHLTFLLLLIIQLFANIPTYDKVGNLLTKSVEGIETASESGVEYPPFPTSELAPKSQIGLHDKPQAVFGGQ